MRRMAEDRHCRVRCCTAHLAGASLALRLRFEAQGLHHVDFGSTMHWHRDSTTGTWCRRRCDLRYDLYGGTATCFVTEVASGSKDGPLRTCSLPLSLLRLLQGQFSVVHHRTSPNQRCCSLVCAAMASQSSYGRHVYHAQVCDAVRKPQEFVSSRSPSRRRCDGQSALQTRRSSRLGQHTDVVGASLTLTLY